MTDCTCQYCYHQVCFHPLRGEDAGLGVLCDGCDLKDIPQLFTESDAIPESTLAITTLLQ